MVKKRGSAVEEKAESAKRQKQRRERERKGEGREGGRYQREQQTDGRERKVVVKTTEARQKVTARL